MAEHTNWLKVLCCIAVLIHMSLRHLENPTPVRRQLQEPLKGLFNVCFVQQDWVLTRLVREVSNHHLVDANYQPFDERGLTAAIRKAGSPPHNSAQTNHRSYTHTYTKFSSQGGLFHHPAALQADRASLLPHGTARLFLPHESLQHLNC